MADGPQLPRAAWRVTLDGTDLTERLAPRLVSLTLRETRGDEADQVDIVVTDHDGKLTIPPTGVTLTVELGWERGSGLPLGLIDKGTFLVDEVKFRGPPDQLTIRARAADFTDALKKRRERAFVGKTLSVILNAIAADNKLTAQVHDRLKSKIIPALGAGAMSDAALLKALGRRFDAVATIKKSRLIFAPIGLSETASGKPLPAATIDRTDTAGSFDYGRNERDNIKGVEAVWHNRATGKRETVSVGEGGSSKATRLRQVYATRADAEAAAQAEYNRKARAQAKLSLTLALGRPDYSPDTAVTLTGFKAEINAQKWLCAELTHTMDGTGGLATALQLESALTPHR